MEHPAAPSVPTPPSPVAIAPGRLQFSNIAAAVLGDGLVAAHDQERIRFSAQGARNASEVHPLVLLANLKLAAAPPASGELGLERLTEWLAGRVKLDYYRIDPLKIDFAAVTAVMSSAYATRFGVLPVAWHSSS